MSGLSLGVLRVGKRYRIINFGDIYEVELEQILPREDFLVKDIHTLERFHLREIFQYGKGKDFEIRELE
ncbi:MAG: hypothetical protein SH819_13900 [Cytophagales bacterium]|nr:hypothetical protein [Cytophagales bacterium]